jgi:hypothetical protein
MSELQDDYKKPISNKEIVELVKQQHEQQKVSEYKFPTEIIELPSKGLIYGEDNPLSSGKVEMKYMTAKEEDILTTQSYIKDGTVLDRLFKSLIVGNGNGLPIKYEDLVTGDKNAIMIAARILGYGKDYEVEINDPFSDNKQKDVIDLTQFGNKPYDGSAQIEPHKNEFQFTLPHSGRVVTFMTMTEKVEGRIKHQTKAANKQGRKTNDNTSRDLTTRLKNTILSVDGDYELKTIINFVDNELFAMDSKELRKYINQVIPDVDLSYEFVSEETGERREMQLPIGVGFFWPSSSI